MTNVRISAAITFFLLGLLLILGTQRYVHTFRVDKPLRETLSSIQGVAAYKLGSDDGQTDLTVTLRNVKDLPATYEGLQSALTRGLGQKDTIIKIRDSHSEALGNDWYKIHYFIEEAATLGNFAEMKDRVDLALHGSGAISTIWVGEDRIFVELRDGSHSLYQVVARRGLANSQDIVKS